MLETAHQINPQQKDINLSGTPYELLKALESLKKVGLKNIKFEFSFSTIEQVETFTRILNREQEEERVANQLRTTYFHHIRGKVQRYQIVKDEDYVSMKKINFTSSYHAHLFMKYYHQRVQQMENQYKYKIVQGKAGYLNIFLNEEHISSLFLNQLIDMKKRLRFLQIKDPELCQKFIYSEDLCQQLSKQKIFHEVWYKGKQSTIIFFTQSTAHVQMKKIIDIVSKYNMTILKMVDFKFSFLINYLLFGLMKKMIEPELKTMKSIDSDFVEVNENKIAIVLHDRHQCFSLDPILQTLEISKKIFFINIKAKDARKYYNFLKKQYIGQSFVNFCYSKKNICLCIYSQKIQNWQKARKMLIQIGDCLDTQSHIILNYFHLQHKQISSYRKQFIDKIAVILSDSSFSIENFEKFIQDKDYKCILKLKDFTKRSTLCSYVGQTLIKIIQVKQKQKKLKGNIVKNQKQKIVQVIKSVQTEQNQNQKQMQSENSNEDIQYDEENGDQNNQLQKLDTEQLVSNQHKLFNFTPEGEKIYLFNFYEKIITKQSELRQTKFFDEGQQQWREQKRLKSFEQQLFNHSKILSKVYNIKMNSLFKDKIPKLSEIDNSIFYYPFDNFPQDITEETLKKQLVIESVLQLSLNKKYIIIVKIDEGYNSLAEFPLFTIQIINTV